MRCTGRAAARKNPFYVYVFRKNGVIVYVGKGSGSRFAIQAKRFSDCCGEIVKRFGNETDAFRCEERLIAKFKPHSNKQAGGRGGRMLKDKWTRQFEAIGSRRYAARLLLSIGYADASKLEALRQVAYGARC